MIQIIIRFLTAGFIVKLLHTIHITWYSSRLTYILVGKFKIDVFDTFLVATIVIFLLYMAIKAPRLEGKPKKAYNIIKAVFHISALSYICWEGYHTLNYHRMVTSLILYGLVELIIIIVHFFSSRKDPPPENKTDVSLKQITK